MKSNAASKHIGSRYKNLIRTVIVMAFAAMSCYGVDSKKSLSKKSPAEGKGIAVIELFTSEGCSSCPPADALVSKVLSENKKDVYILSYHVDYWDRLGWKDPFSKPEFSNRQKQYARYLSLDGVYTPQIVVNGSDQFVGSDEVRLRSSLTNTSQQSALTIEASRPNNSVIRCLYKTSDVKSILLNVAIVEPEATTMVKRGENGGRTLHHVNIVRILKTIEITSAAGSVDIPISNEYRQLPLKIIAYTQQKKDFKITGAAQAQITDASVAEIH